MAKPQRPAIFKWRHFAPEVILCAVRWYLRYSLSYREVEELLVERERLPQGSRHTSARILATARPTVRRETPSSAAHSA